MKMIFGQFPKPKTIGQCIYCRSKTPPLGEEHIIPYSLNGDFVLKEACCKKCEPKINKFESICTKKIFYDLRLAQQYRSSRKHKKKRPKFLPFSIIRNGVSEEVLVPTEEYPVLRLRFPLLPSPGMIVGIPPASDYQYIPYQVIHPTHVAFNKWEENLRAQQVEGFTVSDKFELTPFLLLLAKIAHGFAVYTHGIDGFEHLLPKYLLGEDDKLLFVVGLSERGAEYGPTADADKSKKYSGHLWRTGMFTPDNYDDPRYLGERGATYVVADIQLFRYCHAPVYEVIAGKLLKPAML